MHVEFRAATPEDVFNLVQLVNESYRGLSSQKGWTTEAHLLGGQRIDSEMLLAMIHGDEETILLAEDEDITDENGQAQVIGCVHLKKQGTAMYLGMLTVKPTLQTKGLGKQLLEESEAFGHYWDCNQIEMTVISSRTELIDYYVRRGFKVTSEKRPFPYGNERFGQPLVQDLEFVVLKKPLPI